MTLPSEPALHKLQFYVTTPYKCGYLPDKLAQSLIAAPHYLVDTNIYSGLIQQGFRRSGKFAYRPHCRNCNACIAIRLILNEFTPTRSQKRAYKKHTNLTARVLPLSYHQSHFELYTSYQNLRHAEAELNAPTDENDGTNQYLQFLCMSNVESLLVEFRDAQTKSKSSALSTSCAMASLQFTRFTTRLRPKRAMEHTALCGLPNGRKTWVCLIYI